MGYSGNGLLFRTHRCLCYEFVCLSGTIFSLLGSGVGMGLLCKGVWVV